MRRNLKTDFGFAVQEAGMAMTQEQVAKIVGITRGGVFMSERYAIRKLWRMQLRHERAGTFDELMDALR